MKNSSLEYKKAKNKVEKLKRFYNHLTVYIIVNLVITTIKIFNDLESWDSFFNTLTSFNVLSSWIVWGLVLLIHLLSLSFGQSWEEKKLEKFMEEELNNKK